MNSNTSNASLLKKKSFKAIATTVRALALGSSPSGSPLGAEGGGGGFVQSQSSNVFSSEGGGGGDGVMNQSFAGVGSRGPSSPPLQREGSVSAVEPTAPSSGGGGGGSASESNYRVYIRVRPFLPNDKDPLDPNAFPLPPFEFRKDKECVFIDQSTGMQKEVFHFDGAFCSIRPEQWAKVPELSGLPADSAFFPKPMSQKDIYDVCAKPIVSYVLDGYNASILAYGQTSSGKTHTMMGYSVPGAGAAGEEEGIIPRLCRDLLAGAAQALEDARNGVVRQISPRQAASPVTSSASINAQQQIGKVQTIDFTMEIAFFEIYNENVLDLLDSNINLNATSGGGGNTNLAASMTMASAASGMHRKRKVRSHPLLGVYIEGLSYETITSWDACAKIIAKGITRRHVAATKMNDQSSRSHAVMQLRMTQTELSELGPLQSKSNVYLADLAGSERIKVSQVEGDRLKEAAQINLSLTTLRRVIDALITPKTKGGAEVKVPYRDSLLTWVLSDSLGGNAKSCMIATLCPNPAYSEESFHTLQYASRAKSIVSSVVRNEDQMAQMIRNLQEKIAKEAAAAAAANGLGGLGLGGGMTAEQIAEMNHDAEKVTRLTTEKSLLAKEKESLLSENISLIKEKAVLVEEKASLAKENATLTSDNALLLKEIAAVRETLSATEGELYSTKQHLDSVSDARRSADDRILALCEEMDGLRSEITALEDRLEASEHAAGVVMHQRLELQYERDELEAHLQQVVADQHGLAERLQSVAAMVYGPMLRWYQTMLSTLEETFFHSQRASLTTAVVNTSVHLTSTLSRQLAAQHGAVGQVLSSVANAEAVNRSLQGTMGRVAALYVRVRDFLYLFGGTEYSNDVGESGVSGGYIIAATHEKKLWGEDWGANGMATPRRVDSSRAIGISPTAAEEEPSYAASTKASLIRSAAAAAISTATKRQPPAPSSTSAAPKPSAHHITSSPSIQHAHQIDCFFPTSSQAVTGTGSPLDVLTHFAASNKGGAIPSHLTIKEMLEAFYQFVRQCELEEGIVSAAKALALRGDLKRFGFGRSLPPQSQAVVVAAASDADPSRYGSPSVSLTSPQQNQSPSASGEGCKPQRRYTQAAAEATMRASRRLAEAEHSLAEAKTREASLQAAIASMEKENAAFKAKAEESAMSQSEGRPSVSSAMMGNGSFRVRGLAGRGSIFGGEGHTRTAPSPPMPPSTVLPKEEDDGVPWYMRPDPSAKPQQQQSSSPSRPAAAPHSGPTSAAPPPPSTQSAGGGNNAAPPHHHPQQPTSNWWDAPQPSKYAPSPTPASHTAPSEVKISVTDVSTDEGGGAAHASGNQSHRYVPLSASVEGAPRERTLTMMSARSDDVNSHSNGNTNVMKRRGTVPPSHVILGTVGEMGSGGGLLLPRKKTASGNALLTSPNGRVLSHVSTEDEFVNDEAPPTASSSHHQQQQHQHDALLHPSLEKTMPVGTRSPAYLAAAKASSTTSSSASATAGPPTSQPTNTTNTLASSSSAAHSEAIATTSSTLSLSPTSDHPRREPRDLGPIFKAIKSSRSNTPAATPPSSGGGDNISGNTEAVPSDAVKKKETKEEKAARKEQEKKEKAEKKELKAKDKAEKKEKKKEKKRAAGGVAESVDESENGAPPSVSDVMVSSPAPPSGSSRIQFTESVSIAGSTHTTALRGVGAAAAARPTAAMPASAGTSSAFFLDGEEGRDYRVVVDDDDDDFDDDVDDGFGLVSSNTVAHFKR